MVVHCILLQILLTFFILPLSEPRPRIICLLFIHHILVLSVYDHRGKELVKVCTQFLACLFDFEFILGQNSTPKLSVAESSLLGEICVDSVIKEDYLDVLGSIWHGLRADEDVSGMRIAVDKTLLEDHLIKRLTNKLSNPLQIKSLFMHLRNIRNGYPLLKSHGQYPLCRVLSIHSWYSHVWVIFEYDSASFGVAGFFLEVKFLGQSGLELLWEPAVLEIRKDSHGTVSCKLDQTKVSWDLLFDPLMLNFNCDNFSC